MEDPTQSSSAFPAATDSPSPESSSFPLTPRGGEKDDCGSLLSSKMAASAMDAADTSSSVSMALSGSKEHGRALQKAFGMMGGVSLVDADASMKKMSRRGSLGSVGSASSAASEMGCLGGESSAESNPKVEAIRTVISDMFRDRSALSDPSNVDTAMSVLIHSMAENQDCAEVQEYCVWVLYDLAWKEVSSRERIVGAGALAHVVRGMKSAPSMVKLQEKGCSLLWLLSLKENHRSPIIRSGACEALVEALRMHSSSEDVATAAFRAMKPVSIIRYGSEEFEEAGASEAVARAMSANSSVHSLQSEGCSLLSNLSVDLVNKRVKITGSAELDAILGAMMEHPTEASVQKQACFVLKNLSFADQNARMLAEHGMPVEELLDHARINLDVCKADAEIVIKRLQQMRAKMTEEASMAAQREMQQEQLQRKKQEKELPVSPKTAPRKEAPTQDDYALAQEMQRSAMASGEQGDFDSAASQLKVVLKMKRGHYGEDAANGDLVFVLSCLGYLSALLNNLPAAVKWYDESLAMQRRIPGVVPADYAKTATDIGTLCMKLGDLDKAEEYFRLALDAKRGPQRALSPDAGKDIENLADLYRAKGDAERSDKLYAEAAKCYRSSSLPGSKVAVAGVVTKMASLAGATGRLDLAQEQFQMAVELYRQANPNQPHPQTVDALNNLGYACALNGNDLDAINAYDESVVIQTELSDVADVRLADTHLSLGVLHLKTGDPTAARDNLESSLFIRRDIYGDEDPSQAGAFYSILTNLGEACAAEEDLESAEGYYQDALRYIAQDSREVGTLLAVLGNLATERGRYESARDYFSQALDAAKRFNASPNTGSAAAPLVDMSDMLFRLGNVCSALRNYAAAIDKYELSLKERARMSGPNAQPVPETADTHHKLGVVHMRRGSLSAARSCLGTALEAKKGIYKGSTRTPELCESVAETYRALASACAQGKDFDGAEDQLEKALAVLEGCPSDDKEGLAPSTLSSVASVRTEMGDLAGARGDLSMAQEHYRDALELRRELCSESAPPSPEFVEALNKLGYAHALNGDNMEALELYEESLEAQRLIHGDKENEEMAGTMRTIEVLRARC